MSGDEFRRAGIALFGSRYGWQTQYARALGIHPSTVTRCLVTGARGPVERLVRQLLAERQREQAS